MKKPLKRLHSKLTTVLKDNIAAQNASIAIGGGAYITYAMLVALGLLPVAGVLTSGGCSCSCRCATSDKVMKAADGWQKHAISLARSGKFVIGHTGLTDVGRKSSVSFS